MKQNDIIFSRACQGQDYLHEWFYLVPSFPLGKLVSDQFKPSTICVQHGSPYESSI